MLTSLKSKFIVSFVSIEIIFFALIIALNFNSLHTASQTLTNEKVQASSELLVELIKTPLIVLDLATIDDAIKSFSKIKGVIAVEVIDNDGRTLSSYLKKDSLLPQSFQRHLQEGRQRVRYDKQSYRFHGFDIIVEDEKIGHINFAFNTTKTNIIIQDNENLTYFLTVLALIIGFLVAYLIGYRLEQSLKQLTTIAQHVANDEQVKIPHNINSKNEMGELFKAMHTMQEHISQRTQNLNHSINDLQQFIKALDHSAIVSKTDAKGVITYVNSRFCETSGYSEDELIGKTHRIIRHPDIDAGFFTELWKTISSKHVFQAIFLNRNKKGGDYYVDASIVPLLDNDGNISQYIAIRYEVTDLINARNKALAAQKAKGEFLSNMSHEIRTPMNAILGFAQILQKNITDEKNLSYLNLIEGSSQTLLHIINEILDFSKIESGKLVIDTHPFDPLFELSQASKFFMIGARDKSIRYLAYIDPTLPPCIEGDLTRIKQIMFNFLSNAFKFTPENKTIRIDVTYLKEEETLHIAIKDEGIGISQEAQHKIFNTFEQEDSSTTRKFGGTGLGLAISSKLTELMGGEIKLESTQGEGSTFSVSLPLSTCPVLEKPLTPNQNLRERSIGFITAKEHDEEIIQLIKQYLKTLRLTKINDNVDPENSKDDIIVFIPDGSIEKKVKALHVPALALLPVECDLCNEAQKIAPLVAPYTALDLINALNSFYPESTKSSDEESISSTTTFTGTVLVAEDNKTNQLLIQILLDEYGLTYTFANDGLEAVEALKSSRYDLILMDENMPNMTGVQAVGKIREYEKPMQCRPTPIVALTANVMEEDKKRFSDAGMNDFLAKPIDTVELERVLKRFLA